MSKSSFPFSISPIRKIEPADKQRWFTDSRQSGLQLCVTPKGRRTFYFSKKINGKPTRERLGVFPAMAPDDARAIVKSKLHAFDMGQNPINGVGRATVKQAYNYWLSSHAKKVKKSWADDQRQFDKYLPSLHDRRLATLTRADVAQWHESVGESHGKVTANRCLSLLRAVVNYCIDDDGFSYEGANPASRVPRYPETSRSRYLKSDEIQPFFEALAEEPQIYRDLFLVSLATGGRKADVASMAWEDVDLDFAEWLIPNAKGGKQVLLPLAPAVVAVLRRRQADARGPWVFPSSRRPWTHIRDVRVPWNRILKRSGLVDLHIHDLHRTLGSWQARNGASELIIGQSLGHSAGSRATAVYARLNMQPVRNSVESTVVRLLEAAEGNGDE